MNTEVNHDDLVYECVWPAKEVEGGDEALEAKSLTMTIRSFSDEGS